MARARNIKPGLFENEILGKADPYLTILFTALWCLADREGRLEDRPEKIYKFAFGYRKEDEVNIERSLNELQLKGFIKRYEVDSRRYIQVIEFKKHQNPHHTEKARDFPPCDSKALILKPVENLTVMPPVQNGKYRVVERSDSLIPDSLIPDSLIPDSLIQKHMQNRQKSVDLDFEETWKRYPKRPGANKTQALKAWNARRAEGVSVEEMQTGVQRYYEYCERAQVEPQYVKQAATFFGPDRHFQNDWSAGISKANKFDNWLTGRKGGDDDIIDI